MPESQQNMIDAEIPAFHLNGEKGEKCIFPRFTGFHSISKTMDTEAFTCMFPLSIGMEAKSWFPADFIKV